MPEIRIDRRTMLIAGAAACAWPMTAIGASRRVRPAGHFLAGRYEGSEAWEDLTSVGVAARLGKGLRLTSSRSFGADIEGPVLLTVLGASVDGGIADRLDVLIEFSAAGPGKSARHFIAATARSDGESSPGLRCVVPADGLGGVRLVIRTIGPAGTIEHPVRIEATRGLHGIVTEDITTGSRVRSVDGRLTTTAGACVLVTIDRPALPESVRREKDQERADVR